MDETYSSQPKEEITRENIMEMINKLAVHQFHEPEKPKKVNRWVEKIMNKLGWYRQCKFIVLRESSFSRWKMVDYKGQKPC
jgi:hypothetical protein